MINTTERISKIDMKKRNTKYKEFGKETQKYMDSVHEFLLSRFDKINDEWFGTLYMLAQNYDMFIQCGKEIKDNGLLIKNRFGVLEKNPLIKVQTDSQIQIVKLLSEFGLTPKASIKLFNENNNNDIEEYVNDLING